MIVCLIRTMILYFAVVAAVRIMGKRQLGELGPSELVVAVMISDLATAPMQDPGIPLFYGLLPVMLLLTLEMLLSSLTSSSIKFRILLCGKPSLVIKDGQIQEKEMRRNRYTIDDLLVSLRQQGVTEIDSVMSAVLETDGTISILLKPEYVPASVKDLGIAAKQYAYPVAVICDGRLLRNNLQLLGFDRNWLRLQLRQHGVSDVAQVYLLTADRFGHTFLAKKEAEQ